MNCCTISDGMTVGQFEKTCPHTRVNLFPDCPVESFVNEYMAAIPAGELKRSGGGLVVAATRHIEVDGFDYVQTGGRLKGRHGGLDLMWMGRRVKGGVGSSLWQPMRIIKRFPNGQHTHRKKGRFFSPLLAFYVLHKERSYGSAIVIRTPYVVSCWGADSFRVCLHLFFFSYFHSRRSKAWEWADRPRSLTKKERKEGQ